MLTKSCEHCGNTYTKKPSCGLPEWSRRRFCSPGCKSLSQKGKTVYVRPKGLPSRAKRLPCRICGEPTSSHGTEKNHLYGMVHCGRPECAAESRKIKNENISKKARKMYASGERTAPRTTWTNVKRVSKEEELISPWLESIGWIPQYKFLTKVHTNKLPRMFRLDFALPDHKLHIEIDGSVHRLRKDSDARRDQMMTDRGWTVLRIDANLVKTDVNAVKSLITNWVSGCLENYATQPE